MFWRLIVLISLFLLWGKSVLAEAHHNVYVDINHTKYSRISMVREMDQKYGMVKSFCPLNVKSNEMTHTYPFTGYSGLFGGTFLNTYRQFETKRHKYSIWSYPNSSLTVEPYHYMKDYEAGRRCQDSIFIKNFGKQDVVLTHKSGKAFTSMNRVKVCQAWQMFYKTVDYYQEGKWSAEQKQKYKSKIQSFLWNAHSLSLLHNWSYNKVTFEKDLSLGRIPKQEYQQWMSWNQFVIKFLPRLNRPSCAKNMFPYLDTAMPMCILGEGKLVKGEESECRPAFDFLLTPVLNSFKSYNLDVAIRSGYYEVINFENNLSDANFYKLKDSDFDIFENY
jgi:hypothetical protein